MGLPRSGKTTYAESTMNIPDNATLVCIEDYAEGSDTGPRMSNDAWENVYTDIYAAVSNNEHVVVDGNNTQSYSRSEIMRVCKQFGAQRCVLHVVCTNPRTCYRRMRVTPENRSLVQKTMRHQVDLFMDSLYDIQYEGWDHILYVKED